MSGFQGAEVEPKPFGSASYTTPPVREAATVGGKYYPEGGDFPPKGVAVTEAPLPEGDVVAYGD